MNGCRIAICLFSVLLVAASAAGQSPATPEIHAAGRSSTSESRDVPCQPPAAGRSTPFDTCKYLPLGPVIRPPRALSIADPKYSETARKAKINGTVVVALAINEKGGVDAVKVVRHLEPGLDQNAMDAARQWEFAPATKDGKPVAVQMNVEMTFKLY
ncbi:MAG TPA: energy transducer TonB [Terriglobales bacterium]|nr:energy transducer TonB [Terriglobales bacterium]